MKINRNPKSPNEIEKEEEILSPSRLGWRSFKRDRLGMAGTVIVLVLLCTAFFGNYFAPYDPQKMVYVESLQGPSMKHFMGTDRFGRDQLSRVIAGTRISMMVSFGAVAIAIILGTLIGLIAGYYGGTLDNVMMRFVDVIFAFPTLVLALAAVAAFGPNFISVLVIMGFIFSARFARIVRGPVLSIKEKDFIEGVRSVGAGDMAIMFRFILPNALSPIIVQATFSLSLAIMVEAGLSFLGLGTQPPQTSWGAMLNEGREFLEVAPWLALFPGLAIIFAVLAFNLMGDALRDAFDPRIVQR